MKAVSPHERLGRRSSMDVEMGMEVRASFRKQTSSSDVLTRRIDRRPINGTYHPARSNCNVYKQSTESKRSVGIRGAHRREAKYVPPRSCSPGVHGHG
jgi:hypothetical protein